MVLIASIKRSSLIWAD